MLPAATLDDEIRAAATMASLALTLVVFFTNVRRDVLKEYLQEVDPLDLRTVRDASADLLLELPTVVAFGAAVPCQPGLRPVWSSRRRPAHDVRVDLAGLCARACFSSS
jgi:hypothetical protein